VYVHQGVLLPRKVAVLAPFVEVERTLFRRQVAVLAVEQENIQVVGPPNVCLAQLGLSRVQAVQHVVCAWLAPSRAAQGRALVKCVQLGAIHYPEPAAALCVLAEPTPPQFKQSAQYIV
jgi:hypothetical protein